MAQIHSISSSSPGAWELFVLPMGFRPRQAHHGFSVTREMTVEHSWDERVISNFISMVAGQSLESHSLRVSLHVASWSLPLGLSACTVVLHSHPLGLCPRRCHHSSLCSALLQPCSLATMSHRALGRALYIETTAMYCPQVCSELVNQGQVRILATGTLIYPHWSSL